MYYEQLARERQSMLDEISNLKAQLMAMESDFDKCGKGTSRCFFCANDDSCDCVDDKKCTFKWKAHN